jgi:hypothetical protein
MIHYISVPLVTSNPANADTQQISPNLPACTPVSAGGTDFGLHFFRQRHNRSGHGHRRQAALHHIVRVAINSKQEKAGHAPAFLLFRPQSPRSVPRFIRPHKRFRGKGINAAPPRTIESKHDQGDFLSSSRRQRAAYDRLASFFSALGFAPGKGWKEREASRGASFLAPLGNLEFVDGQFPPPPMCWWR